MIYNFDFERDFSKFVKNNHECLMMCKAVAGEFKDCGRGTTLSPSSKDILSKLFTPSEDILAKLFTSCKARFVQANPVRYEDFGPGISFESQMFCEFELACLCSKLNDAHFCRMVGVV